MMIQFYMHRVQWLLPIYCFFSLLLAENQYSFGLEPGITYQFHYPQISLDEMKSFSNYLSGDGLSEYNGFEASDWQGIDPSDLELSAEKTYIVKEKNNSMPVFESALFLRLNHSEQLQSIVRLGYASGSQDQYYAYLALSTTNQSTYSALLDSAQRVKNHFYFTDLGLERERRLGLASSVLPLKAYYRLRVSHRLRWNDIWQTDSFRRIFRPEYLNDSGFAILDTDLVQTSAEIWTISDQYLSFEPRCSASLLIKMGESKPWELALDFGLAYTYSKFIERQFIGERYEYYDPEASSTPSDDFGNPEVNKKFTIDEAYTEAKALSYFSFFWAWQFSKRF